MTSRSTLVFAISVSLMGMLGCTNPSSSSSDPISGNTMLPNQPPKNATPPDLAAAAKQLGVKEADLVKALGLPDKPPTNQNEGLPPPRLDVKGAAAKLGVSEEKLVLALNLPKPPQGDHIPPGSPPTP